MDVKALRRRLGWTQKQLAEKVPTTIRTISRWETRDMRPNQMARARLRMIMRDWLQQQARSDRPTKLQLQAFGLEESDEA